MRRHNRAPLFASWSNDVLFTEHPRHCHGRRGHPDQLHGARHGRSRCRASFEQRRVHARGSITHHICQRSKAVCLVFRLGTGAHQHAQRSRSVWWTGFNRFVLATHRGRRGCIGRKAAGVSEYVHLRSTEKRQHLCVRPFQRTLHAGRWVEWIGHVSGADLHEWWRSDVHHCCGHWQRVERQSFCHRVGDIPCTSWQPTAIAMRKCGAVRVVQGP